MFSQEVAEAICQQLAEGKSLRKVCEPEGMPAASTVIGWLKDADKQTFAEQYARAREVGYHLLADEVLDISDESGDDWDNEHGRPNGEAVARSRLRVDSRKWMLSKMLPKVYGDKLDLNHGGRIAVAREMTDEELLAHIQRSGA